MRAVASYRFGINNTSRTLINEPIRAIWTSDFRCFHRTEVFVIQLGEFSRSGVVVPARASVCIFILKAPQPPP